MNVVLFGSSNNNKFCRILPFIS